MAAEWCLSKSFDYDGQSVAYDTLGEGEPAPCLGGRGHRLRQGDGDPGLVASQDLHAVEVAAVGDDSQLLDLQRGLGLA